MYFFIFKIHLRLSSITTLKQINPEKVLFEYNFKKKSKIRGSKIFKKIET